MMLKLNRKVEYALMALKYMTQKTDGELTSAREVCDNLNTPYDTTAKSMQLMNSNGIITSVKGVKGGYTLNKNLDRVSFNQFAAMIEKKNITMDCAELNCDLLTSCNISGPIRKLNNYLNSFLDSLTLKDLLLDNSSFNLLKEATGES